MKNFYKKLIRSLFIFASSGLFIQNALSLELQIPNPVTETEWQSLGLDDRISESSQGVASNGMALGSSPIFVAPALSPMILSASITGPTTPTVGLSSGIVELAAALGDDPAVLSKWVHDHIDYAPYYGVMQGAEVTLLTRSGNDADQAALLVELAKAAGHQTAYMVGTIWVPKPNVPNWIGASDIDEALNAFLLGGFAYPQQVDTTTDSLVIQHIFPMIDSGQGWLVYFPAVKGYDHVSAEDVEVLVGYDKAALLLAAGGTTTTHSAVGLDDVALGEHLTGLVSNLVSSLEETYPNAGTEILTGTRMIDPDNGYTFSWGQGSAYYELPDAYRHKLIVNAGSTVITYDQASKGLNKVYFKYSTGNFSRHFEGYPSELFVEPGLTEIEMITQKPYAADGGTFGDVTNTYPIADGGIYVLAQGYKGSATGNSSDHYSRRLNMMLEDGSFDGEAKLTESLAFAAEVFMQETAALKGMQAGSTGNRSILHGRTGLLGQEGGYYIDIKNQLSASYAGYSGAEDLGIKPYMMLFSGMEHAVLEQTQSLDKQAVSTVRILQLANESNNPVYRLDSSNYSSVVGQLSGYTTAQKNKFQTTVNGGGQVILPKNADVALNDWTGEGYIENYFISGGEGMFMAIGGGYNGGENSFQGSYDYWTLYTNERARELPNAHISTYTAADPVDMTSGAYLFDHSDFSMNGPLPLVLSRHYSSHSRLLNGPMGYGWTHSFNIRAQEHSGYEAGLGLRSPEDAASFYVAVTVIRDLVENATTAKEWLTASLAVNWAMEQLTDNAVSIYVGQKVMTFIEQPDGSYTAPPGMTASLAKENGLYVMQERHGKRYEFDASLNLAEIEGQHGNTLTFAYNTQTNLQTVTSSFGPALTFGYNTSNLLTSVSDNDGRSISYQYDNDNNLTNFIDAATFSWGVGYDSEHRVKWMKDPEQVTTIQNFYNSLGQITNQISSSGNDWDFYFTGTRNVSEDPLGNQTAYYLDSKDRTWSIEQPNGARSYSVFDGQNHVVESVSPAGVTNAMVYDIDHNILSTTNAVGFPEQVVSTFGYDSEHHLSFTTNAVGTAEQIVSETTYTVEHKVDTVTVAKGTALETVTDYNYNSDGLVDQVSEGNGKRITTYNYDSNNQYGHPWKINSTDAGEVVTIYDKQGNLKSQTVDGKTTEFNYDARRLQTGTTYAQGTANEFSISQTYWENGLLKTSTDGRGKTTHHYWTDAYKQAGVVLPNTGSTTNLYDTADRLVYARDAEGNWATNTLNEVGQTVALKSVYASVTNQFDIVGNLTNSVVDPDGLSLWTENVFDNLGRNTSSETALSQVESQYDYLNRVTNSVNAADKDWKTEFDELGRVKKTFRPSGNYEEYGFDDLGNRTHFWNAVRKTTTFGVDAQGRITSITNAIDKVTSFSYTDAGNLEWKRTADTKLTQYGYDALNRMVAVTNDGVEVATFDHDNNGNTLLASDSDTSVSFGYDEMNRLIASTQTIDSVTAVVGYGFDLNGNRTNIVYPDGLTVSYTIGSGNRLESITFDGSMLTSEKTISFGYDTANRLDGILYPNGVNSTFGHDAEGRIVSIQHGSFVDRTIQRNVLGFKTIELIDAGIKPTVPATERRINTHNDADQLVSEQVQSGTNWTSVSYSYSANGCLTSSVQSAESVDYTYDYDNRLSSATSVSSVVNYLYDATGARIGRISGTTTNYFVIDYTDGLKRPLAETDASGTITRFYVWSGSQLLCHIEANGDVFYYHSDELGSTLALTDETGTVTDQFAYMPYGYANHSGSTDTPFQWLGGYGVFYDADTDLHLTLYRAYSSKMKRFISADPLGIDGGVNVYAMANRNPLWFVDPYGLSGLESQSFGQQLWNGTKSLASSGYNRLNYEAGLFLNLGGNIIGGIEKGVDFITQTDEVDRFNMAINSPTPYDDMIIGTFGAFIRGGKTLKRLSAPSGFADHHLFPRQFGNWFQSKGIDNIDDFTVTVNHNVTHLKAIHGNGNSGQMPGKWNKVWQGYIDANPEATMKEVYQQAGQMMDEYGLSGLPIHPYKQ